MTRATHPSALASGVAVRCGSRAWGLALCGVLALAAGAGHEARADSGRFDVVVIDAGHGGDDLGAVGPDDLSEKQLVLDVARRLGARLRASDLSVVLTRDGDVFVPLETRTSRANDARGDLFVSIHANASPSEQAHGIETYFAALDSSDEAARRIATRENDAFGPQSVRPILDDPLQALLGDMIATEHMSESSEFAGLAQVELGQIEGAESRGVKQAPFVVLMGVQMPAALVEIGFLTHPGEGRRLGEVERREALARALAKAVLAFAERYDARRGAARRASTLQSAD